MSLTNSLTISQADREKATSTSPFADSDVSAWISWHIAVAVAVVLLTNFISLRVPIWSLSTEVLWLLTYIAVTHVLAACCSLAVRALAVRFVDPSSLLGYGSLKVLEILTAAFAYAVLYVFLRATGAYTSRMLLAVAFALSVGFLILSPVRWTRRLLPVLLLVVSGMAALQLTATADRLVVATTSYPVRPVLHTGVIPSAVSGGALKILGEGLLAVAGDGGLFYVETNRSENTVASRRLPYSIPINVEAFRSAIPVTSDLEAFRVGDVLVDERDGSIRLVASHYTWKDDAACVAMRVSSANAPREAFLAGQAKLAWETVYETNPCLSVNSQMNLAEMGGRLLWLDDQTILLTVGVVGFSGVGSERRMVAREAESSYGKTIRIDLRTRAADVYTAGHRNPQGLYKTPDGAIWAAEHGPRGGDELNLLEQGRDYGWPYVTHGANYGSYVWPLSANQGRHLGYEPPVFAWLPSAGVSSMISVEGALFPHWKDDLLVASLSGLSLFRLHLRDRDVVFAEPIAVSRRVRDLIEIPDGRIVLMHDDGAVTFLEPAALTGTQSRCRAPFMC